MPASLIPFMSYKKENSLFAKSIKQGMEKVFALESEHAHQQYVKTFEDDFAAYNGSRYVVGVNSGTTALELSLKACGVRKGDEVILPAYTYISTALAVSDLGAVPVFADICEETLTLDPQSIKDNLTRKTKAVIPVHIHGNPCPMDEILGIAGGHKLAVIEDCSHAHGAEYKNKKVGNFGIGCFSCHSSKFFSGIGNSGIITLNNKALYERLQKMIRVENDPSPYLSNRTPCRMDAVQAAVLKVKLPYLDKVIRQKRQIASRYIHELGAEVVQRENRKAGHVYRDFVVRHDKRLQLEDFLRKEGVETKVRYRVPLHLTKYYKSFPFKRKSLAVTEKVCPKLLCLPAGFSLADDAIYRTCSLINGFRAITSA